MARTQIVERQIADSAITDAKVKAGAAIATSKLADGANFIKKDGSVAMVGGLNMGGQNISNLATPTAADHATNKSYVDTQIANLNSIFESKQAVRAATTGNILLSNPGTAVFDGVTLANGERLFVGNQTSAAENGIYVFATSSTPLVRASDMDAWGEIPGAFFAVEEGSTLADSIWLCTANQGGTLETTAINFQQIPTTAGLLNANFIDGEVPSGTINGSNQTFTLAYTPVTGSVHLHLNGQRLYPGSGNDYTISGATLTIADAPISGDRLVVDYRK